MKTKYYVANISGGKDSMAMLIVLLANDCPIDEVIFFDTGWEFDCIYKNIEVVQAICSEHNIKFTVLKPDKSFDYLMFDYKFNKRAKPHEEQIGKSWCGGLCRWGTFEKVKTINNYFKQSEYVDKLIFHYIGLANDEQKRISKNKDPHKIYPLNMFQITEQMALDICIENGIDFKENGVCLYDILDRVSCWCCSNKNLKELRNYYLHLPEYWQRLKDYQRRTDRPFRRDGKTIFDLEERFKKEVQYDG